MQSNASKKTPELTGRRAGGRTGGQEAAGETLPEDPVSPRGLAPASRCPHILEHRQSSNPTRLPQLHSHPGMGPHGMAAPRRVMMLGVLTELWGPSPAAHAACTMHAPPRSCPAPVLAFSPVAGSAHPAWPGAGSSVARGSRGARAAPMVPMGLGSLAGQGRTRSLRVAVGPGLAGISPEMPGLLPATHTGQDAEPSAGGNTGTGLSCPGQGYPESCPCLGIHTPRQWGQAGLRYPGIAGCRGCWAPCPAPEPSQAAWLTRPGRPRAKYPELQRHTKT